MTPDELWSENATNSGLAPHESQETIPELATRIRQEASTCDFPSIKDIQDESMHIRYICTVKSEAIF